MSSNLSGRIPRQAFVMPSPSSWNTLAVSPSVSISNVRWSSSGTPLIVKSGSSRLMSFSASPITVTVRRPRMSIFNKPAVSQSRMSNCV